MKLSSLAMTDSDKGGGHEVICTSYSLQLLSKMAPLIGKDIVEKLFLERFALLCLDPLFHVRKVCAANFGDFSSVVGSESTESVLLRKFFRWVVNGRVRVMR